MCEPVLLAEAVAAVPRLMAATPATAAARTARRERAERIDIVIRSFGYGGLVGHS
jgi:hypothetical protein